MDTIGESSNLISTDEESVELVPISIVDDALAPELHSKVYDYLNAGGWSFGWKSNSRTDIFSFWHKHFAGSKTSDHNQSGGPRYRDPCAHELEERFPFLFELWSHLEKSSLQGHTLIRCYANATSYGSEGTIHTDSSVSVSQTAIYYPHKIWHPNWGGETAFFDRQQSDLIASIYPRPNRMVVFPGNIPHVARGVTRSCPVLRITLMFKTEMR